MNRFHHTKQYGRVKSSVKEKKSNKAKNINYLIMKIPKERSKHKIVLEDNINELQVGILFFTSHLLCNFNIIVIRD